MKLCVLPHKAPAQVISKIEHFLTTGSWHKLLQSGLLRIPKESQHCRPRKCNFLAHFPNPTKSTNFQAWVRVAVPGVSRYGDATLL